MLVITHYNKVEILYLDLKYEYFTCTLIETTLEWNVVNRLRHIYL